MRESLFSPLWYRVSGQHPQLRADVRVQRQNYRDQTWHVLIGTTTGRQYRVNEQAYQLIGRFDGKRSVQEVWDSLLEQLSDEAPTQDEVIRVLVQLDQQGLLDYEATPDVQALVRNRDQRAKRQRLSFLNPLAFRLSLGDPSPLLQRLDGLAVALCHPVTLWIWLATMAAAAAAAASNWHDLSMHATRFMATPHYLLLAWLSFPFIKTLHELGHALAVRRWGGEVHAMGVSLLVLTPAPYVDASAAAAFRARYQRVVVGAIGIMVELFLAAIGLMLWLNVQPGLVRDLAFVTIFIASVSTVLFNGNPLLKFDAYYVMCDLLDLPNLALRSNAYWADRLQRFAYGMPGASAVEPAPGEGKWLALYAPLSAAYRVFICGVIVLWLGAQSFALGALACVFVLVMLAKPAVAAVRNLLASAPAGRRRWRARIVLGSAAAALLLFLCVVPFPFYTAAYGVVWLPEQAQVRPEIDGFVTKVTARDGERVEAGQLLLVLDDSELQANRDKLASQLDQFNTDRFKTLRSDPLKAQNLEQDIERVQGELRRADEKLAQLEVRAQAAGTLVMPRQDDLPGAFAKRGSTLGYILDRGDIGVRAAVPERDAALVRERTRRVEVRMAENSGERIAAQLVRDIPAATNQLPSAALGDRGGGPYVTDPADRDAVRTLEPVVLIDLKLPEKTLQRVGGRAWVRFDHGAEPLAGQWYRRLRQLFLQHFNPTG